MDLRLEVVVLPVSDVDRAKAFYTGLGWRLDADFATGPDFRVIQVTPPGSACSVIFGVGVTDAAPGSAEGMQLVADDIAAARSELAGFGVDVGDVFHDVGGVFHHGGTSGRADGAAPENASYGSWLSFTDPDGNRWFVQEVTTRLPGRIDAAGTAFASTADLASALRRAEAAHAEHHKRTGRPHLFHHSGQDENWPAWYAAYLVAEQAGTDLPA
jgi:catechol 2,3-dioxygenase-like lactoylglutathione lyase family enzyme